MRFEPREAFINPTNMSMVIILSDTVALEVGSISSGSDTRPVFTLLVSSGDVTEQCVVEPMVPCVVDKELRLQAHKFLIDSYYKLIKTVGVAV